MIQIPLTTKLFLTYIEVYHVDIKGRVTWTDGLELSHKTDHLSGEGIICLYNQYQENSLSKISVTFNSAFIWTREELADVKFGFENFELSSLKRKPMRFCYVIAAVQLKHTYVWKCL